MKTNIEFLDRSEALRITVEQGYASTDFTVTCKDQDHRDEMACKMLVSLMRDYFERG